MIVTLKQKEIELAVKRFLAAKLGVASDMNFEITFAATRGDNGLTATVDLEEADDTPVVASKPVVQTNAAPAVAQAAAPVATSPIAAAFAPAAKVEEVATAVAEPVSQVAETPVETAPVTTPVSPTKLFG